MTEEQVNTVTKFIGDIVFNNGEKDINVSDLVTVDEVNEALKSCIKSDDLTNDGKVMKLIKPSDITMENYPDKLHLSYKSAEHEFNEDVTYKDKFYGYLRYYVDVKDDYSLSLWIQQLGLTQIYSNGKVITSFNTDEDSEELKIYTKGEADEDDKPNYIPTLKYIDSIIDKASNVDLSNYATKSELTKLNDKLFTSVFPDDIQITFDNSKEIGRYIPSTNTTENRTLGEITNDGNSTFTFKPNIPCCAYMIKLVHTRDYVEENIQISFKTTEFTIFNGESKVFIKHIDSYHVTINFGSLDLEDNLTAIYLYGKPTSEVTPIKLAIIDSINNQITNLEKRIKALEQRI